MDIMFDCCDCCRTIDYCKGTANNHTVECVKGCNDVKPVSTGKWADAILAYRNSYPILDPPF